MNFNLDIDIEMKKLFESKSKSFPINHLILVQNQYRKRYARGIKRNQNRNRNQYFRNRERIRNQRFLVTPGLPVHGCNEWSHR